MWSSGMLDLQEYPLCEYGSGTASFQNMVNSLKFPVKAVIKHKAII